MLVDLFVFVLLGCVFSKYVSIRIYYNGTNCSESGFASEWLLPLPTYCTNKPFGGNFISYTYDEILDIVNVTDYATSGCKTATKEQTFTLGVCHNIDGGVGLFYVNVSVSDNPPFNESTTNGWYIEERFKDEYCETPFTSYWEGRGLEATNSDKISFMETKVDDGIEEFPETVGFCTDEYIVISYIKTNQTGMKLIPRNQADKCYEKFLQTYSTTYNSIIPRCINETTLQTEYLNRIPNASESYYKYTLVSLSYNSDCSNIHAFIPVINGECHSQNQGRVIYSTEKEVYSVFYEDMENCTGDGYYFSYRHTNMTNTDGKKVCAVTGQLDTRGTEPGMPTYVELGLTNDPYFPSRIAFGTTSGSNCSQTNITDYLKDPIHSFESVAYYGVDYCLSSGGLSSSMGFCDKGELTMKQYTNSRFCWGHYTEVKISDITGVNELCWETVTNGTYIHITCVPRYCGEFHQWENNVCNGRGTCGENLCTCDEGFYGSLCETWKCYDKYYDSDDVCNGINGICVSPDKCVCKSGYFGYECDEKEKQKEKKDGNEGVIIGTVSGVSSASLLLLILCSGVCCCVFCCICIVYIIFCCCVVVSFVCGINIFQKKRLSKFSRLEHFDVLLAEQEHEKDATIAHLKISTELFEVNYDEIQTIEMIGEGGSGAIVFLANWRGTKVAFKCFKTRRICSSQEIFDDFEKELNFLASINHPNVIRFYGASMKPPRVGMILEYCENGEILEFIKDYRKKKDSEYPMLEKLRMSREIISAINYVHSRNIIHRDIKSENILIDFRETCKLMDFGISRMIKQTNKTGQLTQRVGTSVYMAPELILTDSYDQKVDTFSFAILLWIIFTEIDEPYGKKHAHIELTVARDPNFRPDLSKLEIGRKYEWIKEVISKCWNHDPSKRYSMQELNEIFENEKNEVINLNDENEEEEKEDKNIVFADNVLERIERDVELLKKKMDDEDDGQEEKLKFEDEESKKRFIRLKNFFDSHVE